MKRLFSIAMILAFIFPIWGSFYYLQFQKQLIQKKVKRQIMNSCGDEDLVFFAFTKEESQTLLNWKHSKEFEYNGEMYDIVYKRETQDSVYYKLWWDKEETAINNRVKKLANSVFSSDTNNQNDELSICLVMKSLFFEFIVEMHNDFHEKKKVSITSSIDPKTVYLFKVTPPPQYV